MPLVALVADGAKTEAQETQAHSVLAVLAVRLATRLMALGL